MYSSETPSIGGDPEFFIFEQLEKRYQVITADKILPSKDKKVKCEGGKSFFDGVQAEINPFHDTCRLVLINNIQKCLKHCYALSRRKFPAKQIVFAPLASIPVVKEDLEGADFECFRFGCSPDFNIYTLETFNYPDGRTFMTRFSGGHIHLGFDELTHLKKMKENKRVEKLIRLLDLITGVISIAIVPYEDEAIRRKTYGRAGTYRIQKHGLEYRTLSSFYLVSPALTSLITGLSRDCFNIIYSDLDSELLDKVDGEKIRTTINTMDITEAKKIYTSIIKPFYRKHIIGKDTNSPLSNVKVVEFLEDMIDKGYRVYFNPYSMLNYWNIAEPMPTEFCDGITKFALSLENDKNKEMLEMLRNKCLKCVE